MMKNKAVFLDKDGTLINDIPYNVDPDLITLSDDSAEGLKMLQEAGYLLVVVSNQAGVAYGYFTEDDLVPVKNRLFELLKEQGVELDGFYYCPHHPYGNTARYAVACDCRKPAPGMLYKAANNMEIDLESSWMIGDILNDIEAGERAGCQTILIDNGNETEWALNEYRIPGKECANINEAAAFILSHAPYEPKLENV
jgi:D-glycero-D-manno-heptose 1,7-bisphosphate phosphatase